LAADESRPLTLWDSLACGMLQPAVRYAPDQDAASRWVLARQMFASKDAQPRSCATGAICGMASVLAVSLLLGCGTDPETLPAITINGQIMGTTYTVKVVEPPAGVAEDELAQTVKSFLDGVDQIMSTYKPESDLSRFNASETTDWFPVPASLVAVVRESLRLAQTTDGAFDVTIGPLVNLWGFGPGEKDYRVPGEAQLMAVRSQVGFGFLDVREEPPALRKQREDLYVDLSAVAKGFAVDQVADYLTGEGMSSYMVEVGGELRVAGYNDRRTPWRIAVENPTPGSRSVYRVFTPGTNGVATSGDYRNFFEVDGRRYSHTIDPMTGRPIEHQLASVSVVHPSAATADGLATALMVLGPERGLAFAEQNGIAVLMIVKNENGFRATQSSNFQQYLVDADE